MGDLRYRYSDNVTEDGVILYLDTFTVIKKTPRGAHVRPSGGYGKKRFVLDGTGKRYCHETKEYAWFAYKKRKQSQLWRANSAMEKAEFALSQIDAIGDAPEKTKNLGKPEYWESYTFD